MGTGNSRSLTIDKDDYSERPPSTLKNPYQKSHKEDNYHKSFESSFNQSFEPSKTDFVRNLASTRGELISEQELTELKDIYEEKINSMQDKNAQLHGATVANLTKTVARVEDKFIKASNKTICGDRQSEMIACLKRNKGEILKCVTRVDSFNQCMQEYRGKEGMYVIHNKMGGHAFESNNTNNMVY